MNTYKFLRVPKVPQYSLKYSFLTDILKRCEDHLGRNNGGPTCRPVEFVVVTVARH